MEVLQPLFDLFHLLNLPKITSKLGSFIIFKTDTTKVILTQVSYYQLLNVESSVMAALQVLLMYVVFYIVS